MRRWHILFIMLSVFFDIFGTTGHPVTPYSGIIGWAGGLASILIAFVLVIYAQRRKVE
jgi:uncharacterized membrane protein (DUF485 family)